MAIPYSGGCDEAVAIAIDPGRLISFASMIMASQVGQAAALQLHASELLLLLGGAVLMAVEPSLLRVPEAEKPSRERAFYGLSSPSS